jgi:Putative glycolipid-binding
LNHNTIRDLDGCIDLDFGFTPATNLSQLRRIALEIGQAVDLPVAWLDVTADTLTSLYQRYERRTTNAYAASFGRLRPRQAPRMAFCSMPSDDRGASAARYGAAELRLTEEQRERQREERVDELRRQFVDGPVLLIPEGGSSGSDARGAVVIPGSGTVYLARTSLQSRGGTLEAERGVLAATDGSRRVSAPERRDDDTFAGDGWTFKAAPGWVVREGARRGDYEVVRQQP